MDESVTGGSPLRLLTAGVKSAFEIAQKAHRLAESEGEESERGKERVEEKRVKERKHTAFVQPNMIQLPICMFVTIKCECV